MPKLFWILLSIFSASTFVLSLVMLYYKKDNSLDKEIQEKQLNEMILMMYQKNTPMRMSDFFFDRRVGVEVMPLIRELERINIIKVGVLNEATTNRQTFLLTDDAMNEIAYMPQKFANNPYGYFLWKYPELNITNTATTTPNKKNNANNNISWYKSSLFINFLLTILSGLILLIIAILLKKYYNLSA